MSRQPERTTLPTISTRPTAVATIVIGIVIWLVAIAWLGWSILGLLFGAAMVAWATFGLLIEP